MKSKNKCRECHHPLFRDTWNSEKDVEYCLTWDCSLFRRPQGYIDNPHNAKLFPKNSREIMYSTAAEAQKNRRAKEKRWARPSGLICENCGGPVRYLCPSELARRKHIFCNKACWHEYQQTHPRWKG
ncbi:MAG: hypothetical protein MUP81_05450 [Dehalococcoidia bacterium]|nr:hypothetical protein [Dehalococcoidia bacterium]